MEENTTGTGHMLTMEEVAQMLRVSRSMAYKLIDPPTNLPAVKVGRTWRVDSAAFTKWRRELSGKAGL